MLKQLVAAEHQEHRERPDGQHDQQHDRRGHRHLGQRFVCLAQILEHEPQMQADVGEHERLQQHVDRVPHVPLLQPGLVPGTERSVADHEPGDHDRQHA